MTQEGPPETACHFTSLKEARIYQHDINMLDDKSRETVTAEFLAAKNSHALKPFSIMSFNILAEIYATQEAFPYCESYALSWCYRRNRILETILEADADIVCLQVRRKGNIVPASLFFSKFFLILRYFYSIMLFS